VRDNLGQPDWVVDPSEFGWVKVGESDHGGVWLDSVGGGFEVVMTEG
jgi:hypothetical protein